MKKLQRLQKQLSEGKITQAQYEAAVADLLEDEDITQEEHDEALEFEPEDDDAEKPIYTQKELDATVVKKARALVKKAARDAGIDLSDKKPQEIIDAVMELATAGTGKEKETDQEIKELRKQAALAKALEATNGKLTIENAVLKGATKFKPVNPAQVVRALHADYADLLEYDDETGILDPKSVTKALQRIAKVEPNLFHTAADDEDLEDEIADDLEDKPGFKGKSPGGAGTGGTKKKQQAAKLETNKQEMLALMGIKKEN